jgi:ribosomal subunit interface protein
MEKFMQINITGRHLDTGEALREHVADKMSEAIGKYFSHQADVNVTFSKAGHAFRSDCAIHLNSGVYLQASGNDNDIYSCFDQSVEKISKQLRRYKRKLKNHHASGGEAPAFAAAALSGEGSPQTMFDDESLDELALDDDTGDQLLDSDIPVVVSERKSDLPMMNLSEAIDLLDKGPADHILFVRKGEHGRELLCLVRRRADGNIGWIDLDA